MKKIKKILIANRAEIAVRVIKTCRNMGIEAVSIYADDDKDLLHVSMADEAYSLGTGSLHETYLNISKIIEIAKKSNADAIHPGYGFLSEKEKFAKAVEEAGIIFIGPRPENIVLMGDKIGSKVKAESLKVPMIPGYHGQNQDKEFLFKEAKKIGFPVLIKASAGGGGKGMRVVRSDAEFYDSLERAKSESMRSFSDDKVLIEKFIEKPRHIEVQVMSDTHGNHLHFFERECSLQRRYQKIVEESPSPSLDDKLRQQICQTAVQLSSGINYRGAGTVEFILDEDKKFYFLEMNTRLQVEHPVTEMVTGYDLVELQVRVAQGEKVEIKQADIKQNGYSIECRVYAEDAAAGFLPATGTLKFLGESADHLTRVDTGYRSGNEITVNYDPMIAKLIVWGRDRKHATENMLKTLKNYRFDGVINNISFLSELVGSELYRSGEYYTNYLDKNWEKFIKATIVSEADAVAAFFFSKLFAKADGAKDQLSYSPWSLIGNKEFGL
jgi:3-methylcrotonyl-CoA carboxylase alpha subunit